MLFIISGPEKTMPWVELVNPTKKDWLHCFLCSLLLLKHGLMWRNTLRKLQQGEVDKMYCDLCFSERSTVEEGGHETVHLT